MSRPKSHEWDKGVRLLSLLLAFLLWLSVALERTGEVTVQAPVSARYLPPGVSRVDGLPGSVQVTISGPRILLCRLPFRSVSCDLDLSGASGAGSLGVRESFFNLDRELKVVRFFPAVVSFKPVTPPSPPPFP